MNPEAIRYCREQRAECSRRARRGSPFGPRAIRWCSDSWAACLRRTRRGAGQNIAGY